jgi:hypothetical protein
LISCAGTEARFFRRIRFREPKAPFGSRTGFHVWELSLMPQSTSVRGDLLKFHLVRGGMDHDVSDRIALASDHDDGLKIIDQRPFPVKQDTTRTEKNEKNK